MLHLTVGYGSVDVDLTGRLAGVSFSTGERGYANLSALYACGIQDAFLLYDRPGLPNVRVSDGGATIWEGRLEDVAIVDGGVRLGAFGYQRALSDTLYTASFTSAAASAIAGSLVTSVSGTNSTQLNTSTALISSPGTTFTDSYEDARPAEILNRIAAAGDTAGNAWEWGVYDDQMLYLRQRGSAGRAWYVDAASLELERSLDKLYNSAYGVYTGGTNTKARTATSTDSTSVTRYGITRQAAVGGDYYDTTVAAYARDTFIATYKVATPRAKVKFTKVFDASGGAWPLYYVRAGDTITIRNLPATASTDVDSIRTFYIVSTSYGADDDVLDVELSADMPTIDSQISQSGGSVGGAIGYSGQEPGTIAKKPGGVVAPFFDLFGTRGLWAFNMADNAGAVYDLTGQARTLTASGGVTSGLYNSLLQYYDFNGSTGYMYRADEAGLDVTGNLTFGGWFWADAVTGNQPLIAKDDTAAQRSYTIYLSGANVACTVFTAATTVTSTVTLSAGAWYFIVARYTPSTELAIFVNGTKTVNTTSIPASLANTTAQLRIATDDASTRWLNGRCAIAFLCSNVVSDDKLFSVFQQTRGLFDA